MYHVKVFYPGHSIGRTDKQIIGCVLYSDENQFRADRVRDHLRRTNVAQGLVFTHDENGYGTSHLVEYKLN